MSVTIPAIPQVVNCGFDTVDKVVVTGNISLSCRPVKLNRVEVQTVGWCPEDLTVSILNFLLHLAAKYFGLVALHTNGGGDLEFFG